MKITNLSPENTIRLFIDNLDDLETLIGSLTSAVTEFFEHCFERTVFCKGVKNARWQPGQQFVVFDQRNSKIDEAEAKDAILTNGTTSDERTFVGALVQ